MGLIDYYLAAWPNDSGNILYSRLSVVTPALRVAKNLEEFTDLFLEKIEPYTRLKQQYDDVNAMLKRRTDKPERPSFGNKNPNAQMERFKKFDRNKPRHILKREQVNMLTERDEPNDEDMEDFDETVVQMSQHELVDEDEEEQEIVFERVGEPEHVDEQDELEKLNAFNMPKPGAMKEGPPACWWKFMKGECTKEGCRLDHSDKAMQELRDKRIRELATAKFGPKPTDLMPTFNRFANQKAMGGSRNGHKKT